MSLDSLDTRITNDRARAQDALAAAQSRYEQVRANPTLSDDGKAKRIAPIYLETKAKVAALQADETKAIADTDAQLRRTLFGTYNSDPSNLIAYRDGQDRASRLEYVQDASALMTRALMNDDATLASAILEAALAQGWNEVVDQYTDANPDQAQRLNDLLGLGALRTRQASVASYFAYFVVTPDELARLDSWKIEEIAKAGGWGLGMANAQ